MTRSSVSLAARVAATFALAFAFALVPAGAHAQSNNRRFQRFIHDASDAYNRGDADGAVLALQHAYEINPAPILLFNIGRAYELANRYATAIEYYNRFLESNPDPEQAQTARDARDAAQRILDERSRAAAAAAAASASPQPSSSPPPPPTPHPREPQGRHFSGVHIGLMGGGALSLLVGGAFGVLALTSSSDFAQSSDPTTRASLQSRGQTYAWGADIGLGVGVVALAAGIVLYLTQHVAAEPAASTSP